MAYELALEAVAEAAESPEQQALVGFVLEQRRLRRAAEAGVEVAVVELEEVAGEYGERMVRLEDGAVARVVGIYADGREEPSVRSDG